MYAERYAAAPRLRPGSLAAAITINGAALVALIYSAPETFLRQPDRPLTTYRVPLQPIPDPIPTPQPKRAAKPTPQRIDTPIPLVDLPPLATDPALFTRAVDIQGDVGSGAGTGVVIDPPAPLAPVLVDPILDQRFAGSFQPDYPADERRAEHEGVVVIRVLIGIDGHVKQVEPVSATSDSFFRATMRRAVGAWRFKPGTRNGIPVERWRQIRVSFHLQEG